MFNGLTEAETAATASCAGLSAGAVPELPVVAYRRCSIFTGWYYWGDDHAEPGSPNAEDLTPHAPAQATIHAQAAEIERLKRERDVWERRARDKNEAHARDISGYQDAVARLVSERAALKAKQVAEVDAVLQAGDPMSNVMFSLAKRPNERITSAECKTFKSMQVKWDAAREALRAAVTKDRT